MTHHCPGAQEEVTCNATNIRGTAGERPQWWDALKNQESTLKEELYALTSPPSNSFDPDGDEKQLANRQWNKPTSGLSMELGIQGRSLNLKRGWQQ